jgi:hypothetical protein
MRWRLGRLTSADCQIAYSNAPGNLTHVFDEDMKEQTTATPSQRCHAVELALQEVIHTAAVKTIGQKIAGPLRCDQSMDN